MAENSRSTGLPTGVIAAAVFVAATAVLLALFFGTGDGDARALLGEYEPAAVEAAVREALAPVQLRPARRLRVTATRVRWMDPSGRPFFAAPRVVMTVQLNAAPDGGILLSEGVAEQPRLRLVQTGPEQWNYDRPLAPFFEEEEGGASGDRLAVRMRDFRVRGGQVMLDLLEASYELRSLDVGLASARLTGPGLDAPTFQIRTAQTELILPDTAEGTVSRQVTVADARVRVVDGAVDFEVDRGTFGSSRLAGLRGVWDPGLGGYGLNMSMTALDARVADLPWLPGTVPEGASGSFQLRVETRPGERTMLALSDLDLRAPGSSATGSVRAVIGGTRPVLETVDLRVDPLSLDLVEAFTGPLPYGGTVTGTISGTGDDIRLDLRGRLTTPSVPEPFVTDLTGRIALTEEGFSLQEGAVSFDQTPLLALRALAPGLPFAGPITGSVRFTGAPGTTPLDLDVRLEAGGGILSIEGRVDPTGAVPSYDLTGRLTGVRLQSVIEAPVPPAEVHAAFTLEGRGFDPATARATLAANGNFTGWESEPEDTLALLMEVAGGVVDVEELRVHLGPVQLAAAGRWDFVDGSGTVAYDALVSELGPLGPFLPAGPTGQPQFARGSLRLTGTAGGTLATPQLEGTVAAREFRWGEWAAESLEGEYAVTLSDGLPRLDLELASDELRTPFGGFDSFQANLDLGRPNFALVVRADQQGERGLLELTADGIIDETGRREVFLRSLELDLRQERWRLPEPARVAWTVGDSVRIDGVELRQVDGAGRILANGVVAPLDDMDLAVDVAGLPIGDVLELVGIGMALDGELSLTGRVAGPVDAPTVDLALGLGDGSFRGVAIRSLEGKVLYEGERLVVDGVGLLGDSARIQLSGTLPARLRLAGDTLFALADDGAVDLKVTTHTFPLATLDPGLTLVENLEGRIEADVQISGTPSAPRLSGSASLIQGSVTIPLLDRRFENIRGQIVLSGREAVFQDFIVESDGFARITGALDFQELTDPALDLTAELQEFRVQGLDDERPAGLWGEVRLGGRASQPVVTGSVRVDDGAVSLAPLQQPELSARLTAPDLDLVDQGFDLDLNSPAEEAGIRISNLTVIAGNELWFVTEEARLRLSGTLTVDRFGSSMPIQGTLRGEAGTFQLAVGVINRQFRIVSAEIRFFGSPEPNPRLDIVASRLVRVPDGADVDVRVSVGGTLQNPSLGLGTATGAEIPDSELLSFLLFGRPTSDLGQVALSEGATGVLGQGLAYTGLAEVLASQINEQIGLLDYLVVDYVPGGGTFATAGFEITDNWVLSAEFLVGMEAGDLSAVALEYQAGIGTLRFGWEPVQSLDRLVGTRTMSYLRADIIRQAVVAWRRRWTY